METASALAPLNTSTSFRPHQSHELFDRSQLKQCQDAVNGWWSSYESNTPSVVVMTYATDPTRYWLLGLSAALHSIPLILVGRGRKWTGLTSKYRGVRRALQTIGDLNLSKTAILVADADDTVVGNAPTESVIREFERLASNDSNRVLVAGECNSYPLCYQHLYAKHESFNRCLTRSRSCYPNGGAYAAGLKTISRFVDSILINMGALEGVERGDDQSAIHRMYLGSRFVETSKVTLKVDDASKVFNTLFACAGSRWERGVGRPCKGRDRETRPYDPLSSLRAVSEELKIVWNESTLPFVFHANGKSHRLKLEDAFLPLRSALGLSNLQDGRPLRALPSRLLAHKILLIDDASSPGCVETHLENVLRAAQPKNNFRDLG